MMAGRNPLVWGFILKDAGTRDSGSPLGIRAEGQGGGGGDKGEAKEKSPYYLGPEQHRQATRSQLIFNSQ